MHPRWTAARPVGSAILYLLAAGERSHWHTFDAAEVWHFAAGDPLELSVWVEEDASVVRHRIGGDDPRRRPAAGGRAGERLAGGPLPRRVDARRLHRGAGVRVRDVPARARGLGAARLMPTRTSTAAGPPLTLRQLNRTTLLRQSLLERSPWTAAEAVGRLAGLQAQHANSPYVALWSRVDGFTIPALEAALTDRSVVKATLMRSTLHLVAGEDVAAFDAAGSEGRVANWRPTARRAGVDMADLHRRLLAYAAEPRTVAEMEDFVASVLPEARIADHAPAGVRRVAYRVASAPGRLVHVPPSGMWASHGKPRYIDLGVWLPEAVAPDPDAALQLAAERYLSAYGPASVADFAKWVGQSRVPKARAAIDAFGDRLRRSVGPDGRELVDLDGPAGRDR